MRILQDFLTQKPEKCVLNFMWTSFKIHPYCIQKQRPCILQRRCSGYENHLLLKVMFSLKNYKQYNCHTPLYSIWIEFDLKLKCIIHSFRFSRANVMHWINKLLKEILFSVARSSSRSTVICGRRIVFATVLYFPFIMNFLLSILTPRLKYIS